MRTEARESACHGERRMGFTLVEILVALVLVGIVGGGLTALLAGQMRFQRAEDALRDSRSAARAALNVMRTDMRMLEGSGAVAAAAARDITIRVPYAFGVVCASGASQTDVSLFPADTTMVQNAGLSGWAWRADSGDWNYVNSVSSLTDVGTSSCDGASIEVLTDGRSIRLAPGVAGLEVGSPIFLFQQIRYRFDESGVYPGRDALYRTIVTPDTEAELVAPFASTARFRFYTDWASASQTAVPADLSTIVGFEVVMDAESVNNSPRNDAPQPFSLSAGIFFQNATD